MIIGVLDNTIAPGDRVIPWLSECSNQWCFKPLKYFCPINRLALSETTEPEYEFLYIDINSVNSQGYWTPSDSILFRDAPSRARRIVQDGDVIVSTVRTYLKAISFIEKVNGNLICSTGFAVLSPGASVFPKFLFYWARSEWFVNEIVARSVGVSYPAINAIEIGNLPFPTIPTKEQQAIADFLDRETASIDGLIAKKQRLIELLQEQRTALITNAVTKGLNPNAPMKDSGVEWLGAIPAHWNIWKVTHGFNKIGSGTTPLSNDLSYYDGDIPWVTTTELRETVIYDTNTKLTHKALEEYSALKLYPEDTILIAMYGATIGRLGILGVPAIVNQACCAFSKGTQFCTKFFYYWLIYRRPILVSLSIGGGQPNLSQDDLKALKVALPQKQEQQAIADYLDNKTERLDNLIAKINQAIEKLQEYRSALITAAVTGKIDVREELKHG